MARDDKPRKLTAEELSPTPKRSLQRPLPPRQLERHERIEQELEAARAAQASTQKPEPAKDESDAA